MIETRTIFEAIYYLLKKLGKTDKIKLVKLFYLADKYHLIKYGRTISNDVYWAMPHGPVGSTILDSLNFNNFTMSENEFEAAKVLYRKATWGNGFVANPSANVESFDHLSETDLEALDFVIKHFGEMTPSQIREFSHRYPEWKQYEKLFNNKKTARERLQPEELLSVVDGDNFPFSTSDLERSKKFISGAYE